MLDKCSLLPGRAKGLKLTVHTRGDSPGGEASGETQGLARPEASGLGWSPGSSSAAPTPPLLWIVDVLLLNVLSFFLPACLPLDFLLSRVADEAFYKQPFADVIGYVYVAKTNSFSCFDSICLELCHKLFCSKTLQTGTVGAAQVLTS